MKKAVKTVSFMVITTLLSKIMGLVRDSFVANEYGTSIEASAYMSASHIPVSFFDLTLGVAVLSTFIPVFNDFLEKNGKERAFAFSNNFVNFMILVSAVFCVLGMCFSEAFTSFFVSGMEYKNRLLTAELLRIMFPTIICTTLAFCFVGILQSLGEFTIPSIISLVSNLAVIAYLAFFNEKFGLYGLAVAMVIGWSLQALVQIPALVNKKYKYKFILDFKDEGIKQVFVLALPILISSWVQPISVLVNQKFASYIEGGVAISGLDYANRIYIIIVGVFTFAITNYIFPSLSRMCARNDSEGFKTVLVQSLRVMLLIVAPIMAGMMLLAPQIISLIYERGEFGKQAVAMTSSALFYYSIGMVSYGINEICNKCFYATKNGKSPMIASLFGIATTCVLSFTFVRVLNLGIGSVALSSAISTIITSVVLMIMMQKKVCCFFDRNMLVFVMKVALSTITMAVVAVIVRNITTDTGMFFNVALTALSGCIVYVIMICLLKIDELKEILPILLKKKRCNG